MPDQSIWSQGITAGEADAECKWKVFMCIPDGLHGAYFSTSTHLTELCLFNEVLSIKLYLQISLKYKAREAN